MQSTVNDTFENKFPSTNLIRLADLTTEGKSKFCHSIHIIQSERQIMAKERSELPPYLVLTIPDVDGRQKYVMLQTCDGFWSGKMVN